MDALLQKLHDTVKAITKTETHVVFVDFIKNPSKLYVYEYSRVPKNPLATLNSAPFEGKFYTTDITRKNSRVHDYITSNLADSSIATDMCVGINPEYTTEQIEDVGLGFFVFGMKEREAKPTENKFKEFHGFMTCGVKTQEKTLKIDLICASLKGLGTQLMKTIFGYATLNNYQRIELDAATDLLACFYYPRFQFELTEPEDIKNKKKICEVRRTLRSDSELIALVRKLIDKMYPMALELETYNTKLRSTITAREAARKAREAEAAEAEAAAEAPAAAAAAEAPAEAAEEEAAEKVENVMAYYQDVVDEAIIEAAAAKDTPEGVLLGYAIEDFEKQSKIIKFRKAIKAGKKTIKQAATELNLSEELLDGILAAGAGGGPAPAAAAEEEAAEEGAGGAPAAPEGGPAANGSGRTRKRKRSLKKKKKGGKNKTKRLKRKVGRNTRKKRNNVH